MFESLKNKDVRTFLQQTLTKDCYKSIEPPESLKNNYYLEKNFAFFIAMDAIVKFEQVINDNNLIGFISIFPKDCNEENDLTPWYATMYVKKEYRKKGYSRILNDAILKEAKNRGFTTIYLKTGETLYKFEL